MSRVENIIHVPYFGNISWSLIFDTDEVEQQGPFWILSILPFLIFQKNKTKKKPQHVIQAGCPSHTHLPCPTQYACSVGMRRLALVAKLNQRLFGTTKSPVHPHQGTAGSLHCATQKSTGGCNQLDLQAAALLICVMM